MATAYDTTYVDQTTVIPTGWLNALNDFFYTAFSGQDDGTIAGASITITGLTLTGNLSVQGNTTLGNASGDTLTISAGSVWINDTANGNSTIGLTINQGANDDEILAFKSSDIAHGLTSVTETDTYLHFKKADPNTGIAHLIGIRESADTGIIVEGLAVSGANTTKSTAGRGLVELRGGIGDGGTGKTDAGADGNLAVIANQTTTRFIFDVEGSFHADVESTTFDEHDDIALIEAMDREFQRRNGDPVASEYMRHLQENRDTLQRLGIVNYYDASGKRVMVNFTKQAMLHNGAIRQLAAKHAALESKLLALESK